jgi:hypothetical protein
VRGSSVAAYEAWLQQLHMPPSRFKHHSWLLSTVTGCQALSVEAEYSLALLHLPPAAHTACTQRLLAQC